MRWKWSQFNFEMEIDDRKFVIIRNTLTTSTVKMSADIKELINSLVRGKRNIDDVSISVKEYIKALVRIGILVDKKTDEKRKYLDIFHRARMNDKTFAVYIVTTERCQLKCPYCFERNISREGSMSKKTAERVVGWIEDYLDSHKACDKLRIVLYGGEPLLNKSIIKYILPKTYEIAMQRGIKFEHGIITNGEFLDTEILRFLNKFNLDRVQITVDGPRDVHDKRRVRANGSGTFDRIMENILNGFSQGLLKEINLRVNFDRQNVKSIPRLFDFLASYNLQRKIKLSFGIITPTIFYGNNNEIIEDPYFKRFGFTQKENAENYLWLWREAKRREFGIPEEYLVGPWCVARKIHSAIVDYNGRLFKCISLVGREEFSFGDIYSTKSTIDPKFNNFDYIKDCLYQKCPFVPICGGNCRFQSYINSGSFSKTFCQRELVERINKGLLKLNFG